MKKGFLTGLLLFGIFFGAGNLIFPPDLGKNAGENFNSAIFGFILSGVGLTILTLIVGTLDDRGYRFHLSSKISPLFALLFLVVLYLSIGPFFAIPRTCVTSFLVAIEPISGNSRVNLFIYTFIYFLCAYLLALFPSRLVDSVGKLLTPIFIILIIILIILGLLKYNNMDILHSTAKYSSKTAFSSGFLDGYLTLDSIASIAFSVIAINTLKKFSFSSKKEYIFSVYVANITALILFSILYYGLACLGNKFPVPAEILNNPDIHNGVYIITQASKNIFGAYGQIFIGILVIVTCFTTTVGLIAASTQFFYETFPIINYKIYLSFFTLISFIITNMGLNNVIAISLPVLNILYPLSITILLIVILDHIFSLSKNGPRFTIYTVLILSILDIISKSFHIKGLIYILSYIPLYNQALVWLIPALILMTFSVLTGFKNKQ